jgi:hypothetical protein
MWLWSRSTPTSSGVQPRTAQCASSTRASREHYSCCCSGCPGLVTMPPAAGRQRLPEWVRCCTLLRSWSIPPPPHSALPAALRCPACLCAAPPSSAITTRQTCC